MDSTTDIELVDLALDGDPRAFEKLFQRHYDAVYRMAYKWCGVKADAEDIAQEVFVKLARSLASFSRRAAFCTWLYRITINTAKDFHRKIATRRAYETDFVRELRCSNPAPDTDEKATARRLYAAIDQLPVKQKTAVLLVLGEGLTHKEAAGIMRCPEATVSWRIRQARTKLRKTLPQEK